jgi:hypothetical protein
MSIQTLRFRAAKEQGEVTERSGYHKPNSGTFQRRGCGCTKTTPQGAYRDVTVVLDERTIHYYHQSPVVVEYPDHYRLSGCGYRTRTTKERINRYIPRGYFVRQIDFDWYLETPDGREAFRDGMEIPKEDH